jgi:hypothetical protein
MLSSIYNIPSLNTPNPDHTVLSPGIYDKHENNPLHRARVVIKRSNVDPTSDTT